MELALGDVIEGRYVVEALLGEGGMARVWRVRHARLGTLHACKVLALPHDTLRRRMVREGHLQGRLSHRNVVAVTDFVQIQRQPALIMELIRGPSLAELLAAGPLTLEQIDDLARGIFAGVAAAHRAGLAHRDLKPGNILLALEGGAPTPKIADFGLAKLLGPAASSDEQRLTRTGLAMGTPAYMAPEQIRDASAVDERADLWSLGCILYEMACGEQAFRGDDLRALYNAVCDGQTTPPQRLRFELPTRWIEAIAAALVVDPGRRVESSQALAETWGRLPSGTRPGPPRPSPGSRR